MSVRSREAAGITRTPVRRAVSEVQEVQQAYVLVIALACD